MLLAVPVICLVRGLQSKPMPRYLDVVVCQIHQCAPQLCFSAACCTAASKSVPIWWCCSLLRVEYAEGYSACVHHTHRVLPCHTSMRELRQRQASCGIPHYAVHCGCRCTCLTAAALLLLLVAAVAAASKILIPYFVPRITVKYFLQLLVLEWRNHDPLRP